jgi:nucleoside-diphosphate-sugar epimerase
VTGRAKFTVLGADGFIGSHVSKYLRSEGFELSAPTRGELQEKRFRTSPLGHVISCLGVTQDFRIRLLDTMTAHVSAHVEVIENCEFESITYLSSTRLYRNPNKLALESDAIAIRPGAADEVYNASKVAGEAVILAATKGRGRVVRLSNVYGPGQTNTFLAEVLSAVIRTGAVTLKTSLGSAKDYISVLNVVQLLPRVAVSGHGIYNVASGVNTTNGELLREIARHLPCDATVEESAGTVVFPRISIERAVTEFGFVPSSVLEDLPSMLSGGDGLKL